MTNPVLSETGPLALSVPLTLVRYDGTTVSTRGVMARLEQSEGQVESAFSESDRQCYVSGTYARNTVEFVRITRDGDETDYRVIDTQPYLGAEFGSVDWETTRFMLQDDVVAPTPTPPSSVDFDPTDFDTVNDFG